MKQTNDRMNKHNYVDSEIVFALVGAVGTDLDSIIKILRERLENFFRYTTDLIYISHDILRKFSKEIEINTEYKRINHYMDLGTKLRKETNNGILAMAAADLIQQKRKEKYGEGSPGYLPRYAFIIKSLKNTEEVKVLRTIYGNGFYLIGVYESAEERKKNLCEKRNISKEQAKYLLEKDEDENVGHGQQARDTFQMSDFFIDSSDEKKVQANIYRILDLIFGSPFITPTFGEFAMFMAHCASLRSADLSRQIGAVVCKNDEILAMGVNDCPSFGGGLYWPKYNKTNHSYEDLPDGRDYMRGYDTNKKEFVNIVEEIFDKFNIEKNMENFIKIRETSLGNLTEFGRVVHAEMEALVTCARNNISSRDTELYVTTFPCHNCAKHIIAAGVKKVVYIEAYPKSKTFEFYKESITTSDNSSSDNDSQKVLFLPFFGVGPRRFYELFAMSTNFLPDKKRKEKAGDMSSYGKIVQWSQDSANLRSQMLPTSYLDREVEYSLQYNASKDKFLKNTNKPQKKKRRINNEKFSNDGKNKVFRKTDRGMA